jgi:hypothetical protein
MSTVEKLNFKALTIVGANYLSWGLDIDAHLTSKNLQDTINTNSGPTIQQRAQALVFIRHHLKELLKAQYLNKKNPKTLWVSLKKRYDHTKTIHLPIAKHDWVNL